MSLFNRPAWARQQISDDEDEKNIFSHSGDYQDIVAEQEKRKREKAERKKAKAQNTERRPSSKRESTDEPIGNSTARRRRITSEEKEKLLRSVGLPAIELDPSDRDEHVIEEGTPVRRSPRKNNDSVKAPRATLIDLGGSSEEDDQTEPQAAVGAFRVEPSAPVEEVPDDSDDEFAELARKARQQRQQSNNRSSRTPAGASPSPGVGISNQHDKPPDPTIQLFISSSLPGTNPLIVHRKLSQPTAAIRHAWCQKQNFTKEFSESVFFIHRMRRVYDVTTCRSLGLEVDQHGNVTMTGAEGKEGVEKVMLEAVTDEIFQQMKEQKAKDALVRSGELPAEAVSEPPPAPEREKSNIRIFLKAKNAKDFRLMVKSTTTMGQIAAAYCKKHLGDSDKQVRLEFDGEELNPDECIQDTEIEDGMSVDVYMVQR